MLKFLTRVREQRAAAVALTLLLLATAILTEEIILLLVSVAALLLTVVALVTGERVSSPAREEGMEKDNQLSSSALEDKIHVDSSDIPTPDEPAVTGGVAPTAPQTDPEGAETENVPSISPQMEPERREPPPDPQPVTKERDPEEESTPPEVAQQADEWLSTRDRADALLRVSQIHQRFQHSAAPLSLLIGEATTEELSTLSGEDLDQAIACKEAVDQTASGYGVEGAQQLFERLLYCSMSHDRSAHIGELLEASAPQLMACMKNQEQEARSGCFNQLFEQLVSLGEFLPSERGEVTSLWEEEFSPEPAEEVHNEEERVDQALEQIEQGQTEPQPDEPTEKSAPQPKSKKRSNRERLHRKRVEGARKLTQRHGIHLEQLIGREESDQESSEQLLNLILSARGETGEEYSNHVDGTAADLMVESILRIRLQNRICQLYREYRTLPSYEATEERIMESLNREFGDVVINNHRSSIRHHLEWAAGTDSSCNKTVLNRRP